MNINIYDIPSYYNNFTGNKSKDTNLKAKYKKTSTKPLRKFSMYMVAGFMALAGINTCSDEKCSGVEDYDGIQVEFTNVKPETKDSLMKPVLELRRGLSGYNDFLKGTNIYVARSFTRLNIDNNSFKKHVKDHEYYSYIKGTSFYSDNKLPKQIVIQECSHSGSGSVSKINSIRQTLMHEVGHEFDNYFGHNHDAEYAKKWDELLYSKEKEPNSSPYYFKTVTEEDKKLDIEYTLNCGLSDNNDFKKSMLKDINYVKQLKQSSPDMLPKNIEYYIQGFNFSKEITLKNVELADGTRAEVYANLFSYAVGQNDGDREKFINCFKNCYEIVKSDIKKYVKK